MKLNEGVQMITLKLKHPIAFGSEMISELTFREPKARDMRMMPMKATTGDILDLAARLSGQLPSTIGDLCIADFQQVVETVGEFFTDGQTTGEML
jgi:hypothetical protein